MGSGSDSMTSGARGVGVAAAAGSGLRAGAAATTALAAGAVTVAAGVGGVAVAIGALATTVGAAEDVVASTVAAGIAVTLAVVATRGAAATGAAVRPEPSVGLACASAGRVGARTSLIAKKTTSVTAIPSRGALHIGTRSSRGRSKRDRPRCEAVADGVTSCARFQGDVGRFASSRLARAAAESSFPCMVGSWPRGMVAAVSCGTGHAAPLRTSVIAGASGGVGAASKPTGTGGSVAERPPWVVSAGPPFAPCCRTAASRAAFARRAASSAPSVGRSILTVLVGGGRGLPADVGSPAGWSGGRVTVQSWGMTRTTEVSWAGSGCAEKGALASSWV